MTLGFWRRRRGMRRIATAGALGVTLAGGLVVSQTLGAGGGSNPVDGRNYPEGSARAAEVLHKAAAEAESSSSTAEPPHRAGFSYVETKRVYQGEYSLGPKRPAEVVDVTIRTRFWNSVDGSTSGLKRRHTEIQGVDRKPSDGSELAHELAQTGREVERPPGWSGERVNIYLPNHRYLESLSTDPDALLAKLCPKTATCDGKETQDVFLAIVDLVTARVLPPDLRAGLFEATAKIDGVTVVEDVPFPERDQPGVAVAFTHKSTGTRTELVFDPDSYAVWGSRSVETRSGDGATSTMIVEKGFVSEKGRRP